MSFLAQNWPILLFAGVMIYMHFFMHRGHGRHRHRDHTADPASGRADGAGNPVPEQPKQDRHRHGGC
jgi:hypothetical protein